MASPSINYNDQIDAYPTFSTDVVNAMMKNLTRESGRQDIYKEMLTALGITTPVSTQLLQTTDPVTRRSKSAFIESLMDQEKTPQHLRKYLLDYTVAKGSETSGYSPLHWALSSNQPNVVDAVIKALKSRNLGGNIFNIVCFNRTLLHWAASTTGDTVANMELLLAEPGWQDLLNKQTNEGRTARYLANERQNSKIEVLLASKGAQ